MRGTSDIADMVADAYSTPIPFEIDQETNQILQDLSEAAADIQLDFESPSGTAQSMREGQTLGQFMKDFDNSEGQTAGGPVEEVHWVHVSDSSGCSVIAWLLNSAAECAGCAGCAECVECAVC